MADTVAPVAIAAPVEQSLPFKAPAPEVVKTPTPKLEDSTNKPEPTASTNGASENGTAEKAEDAPSKAAVNGKAEDQNKADDSLVQAEPESDLGPSAAAPTATTEDTVALSTTNGDKPAAGSQETKDAEASAANTSAPSAAVAGDKRKADEGVEDGLKKVDPATDTSATETNGKSAPKKAKTDTEANGTATNGATVKKGGSRTKREKNPLPSVGRTARKTRSQGPVA